MRYLVHGTCVVCGEAFTRLMDRPSRKPPRTCGAACLRLLRVRWEERECAVCGKTFKVHCGSTARTCSRICAGELGSGKDPVSSPPAGILARCPRCGRRVLREKYMLADEGYCWYHGYVQKTYRRREEVGLLP